jgi:hypothetical protein
MERAQAIGAALGLEAALDVANDPFFGRAGPILSDNQRTQRLKCESLIAVNDAGGPTACASFNSQLDHVSKAWPPGAALR